MDVLIKNSQFVTIITRDELTCLNIKHPLFSAVLALQGAQLIEFAPTAQLNWLWLSPLCEYKKGSGIRGGVPICWPWFGNALMNTNAVKASINNIEKAPAHGFARIQDWKLNELSEDDHQIVLTLALPNSTNPHWQAKTLKATVQFTFTDSSLTVALSTHNVGNSTVTFAQALHTYFPTDDIHQTRITGFNNSSYIETLENWSRKTQSGDIEFTGETDRIYFGAAAQTFITPSYKALLKTEGSNSAVVWNPWVEKSTRLSQFALNAWQEMFCVETANAHENSITLAPNQSHTLAFTLTRV